MALNIWPVDPARLRECEGHTLSRDTRMKLLFNGNAFDGDKIEPRRDRLPFAIMGALLVVGCAWLAGAMVGAW